MCRLFAIAIMFGLAGCEEGYYPQVIGAPAYVPIEPEYHAGTILPPLGGGRPVGGAIYSGYGNNIMVTPSIGGPVGSTMVSGY